MFFALSSFLVSLFTAAGFVSPQEDSDASTYVIRGAGLVSPERDEMLERAAVVVADGRIAWVGEDRALPDAWAAAETIVATGRFVVPGFVDQEGR